MILQKESLEIQYRHPRAGYSYEHTEITEDTMATLQELSEAIQKGAAPKAKELTTALLAAGTPAADVLNKGLLDGMEKIGKRFKANEVYIPEVLIAARAMNQGMEILKPELVKAGVKPIGKMLLGTVKGEIGRAHV
jgi:5-methyltetrahydrofolate--homocysteine methyltransferase